MATRIHLGVVAGLAAISVALLAAQARDVPTPLAGTATIIGKVVTDDASSRPLGRAIVTVRGAELPISRSAITEDDGRFLIRNLPPGRVTIAATKRGYVAGAYGAARPGRPGTPAQIAAGQTFDATIRMAPAGVVTGLIRDERGEPIPGLRVFAIDAQSPVAPEATRSGTGAGVETDDRGIYRIFDLVPGTYLIAATPTVSISGGTIVRPSVAELDRVFARLQARDARAGAAPVETAAVAPSAPTNAATLAVMFFPGTTVMADATRVKLGRGEVREGLDFAMRVVPVTTIEGTLVSPDGALPPSVQMSIVSASTLRFFFLSSANPRLTRAPGADGRFLYTTIAPGHYTIVARASGSAETNAGTGRGGAGMPTLSDYLNAGPIADAMYAFEEIDVVGQPVTGVTLRLQRGSRVSGRITFDAATLPAPSELTAIRVVMEPLSEGGMSVGGAALGSALANPATVSVRADGSFLIPGVAPGRYQLKCSVPASAGQGWWLRSALVGERDLLDSPIEIVLGTDVTNATLTVTDRHSELSGTLRTANGAPAPDHFVIALPADPALRTAGSRRLKSTRPGTDGRFSFADLPAGDYLLVALTDVEPNEWQQPEFLASIAAAGVKVTLGQGERKTQDLRLGRGGVEPSWRTVR